MRRSSSAFAPAAPAVLAAALLLAACGGTGPPLPTAPPPDLLPRAEELRAVLAEMAEADSEALLLRRFYVYGLTPVFEDRFKLASGPLAAFIPGRHPARSDELVVVVAEAGTPGAAVLVEEARLLNARAAFAATPERTVLVALLPPGTGPLGLAAVLDAPVWLRPLVVGALVVGGDARRQGYEAIGRVRGVPVAVVAVPAVEQGPVPEALALAVPLRAALTAAANGAPATPDVGVPPPDTLVGPRIPIGG